MKIINKSIKAIFTLCLVGSVAVFAALFLLRFKLDTNYKVGIGETLKINTKLPVTAETVDSKKVGESYKADLKLFGVIPYSSVDVQVVDENYVEVLGTPFGMKIYTEGVLVVDTTDISTDSGKINPAQKAGLKVGDYVISVDKVKITCNEDLSDIVERSGGKELSFLIKRDGKKMTLKIKPVLEKQDKVYRLGVWVRDSSAGVGTLTFYNPAKNILCGLGHGICDTDTDEMLNVDSGQMVTAEIISVKKGKTGEPGELQGRFTSEILGNIDLNSELGVYGKSKVEISTDNLVQVAHKQEIKEGAAQILCTVSGERPRLYSCTVKFHTKGILQKEHNLTVTVTDGNLIEETGGIVQGMSGSPIIQNGKLIGAITHVLVDDPTSGYAIFAENMLETAQSVANENKLKDAS